YQQRIQQEKRRFAETQIQIDELKQDLPQYNQIDLSGLGVLGRGVVAKALDSRIPDTGQLLGRLNSYGQTREDARNLLNLRAQNAEAIKEARKEEFNELIKNQEVAERTRKFAQQKVDLINSSVNSQDKAFAAQQ